MGEGHGWTASVRVWSAAGGGLPAAVLAYVADGLLDVLEHLRRVEGGAVVHDVGVGGRCGGGVLGLGAVFGSYRRLVLAGLAAEGDEQLVGVTVEVAEEVVETLLAGKALEVLAQAVGTRVEVAAAPLSDTVLLHSAALEGLGGLVRGALVPGAVGQAGKGLATLLAHVGPLCAVGDQMRVEVRLPREHLVAEGAAENLALLHHLGLALACGLGPLRLAPRVVQLRLCSQLLPLHLSLLLLDFHRRLDQVGDGDQALRPERRRRHRGAGRGRRGGRRSGRNNGHRSRGLWHRRRHAGRLLTLLVFVVGQPALERMLRREDCAPEPCFRFGVQFLVRDDAVVQRVLHDLQPRVLTETFRSFSNGHKG